MQITDEGVEEAFEVVAEVTEKYVKCVLPSIDLTLGFSVKTAGWIGDCFLYTTATNRLCYFVGSESYTISPSDTYVPVC